MSGDTLLLAVRLGLAMLVAVALAGAFARVRLWLSGRPARVAVLTGLAALPKRYLVDLHNVVARDRYAEVMHVAAAGGLLVSAVAFLVHVTFPGFDSLRLLGLLGCAIISVGVAMVLFRRVGNRGAGNPHRSRGEWTRFGLSLLALLVGFWLWFAFAPASTESVGIVGIVASALILGGGVEVLGGLTWGGPMRHAFAGALNLAFHPRPSRFASGEDRPSALRPIDLAGDRLGVEAAADLPWNRILNLDACVQCGRCEAMCPAFAAGQPLNPKTFIHDLAAASGLTTLMGRYAGQPHPGLPVVERPGPTQAAVVPEFVSADTLWACTTCRACVYECPMMIEHVDAMVDLRRHQTLERGALPGRAPEVLEAMRATDTPSGRALAERFDWAVDLSLRTLAPGEGTDVLLWVGEAGFDPRSRRTLRALVALLRQAEVDFAVLGEAELDCGDTARRLGDEAIFQDLARRNLATLAQHRFDVILTADPHAYHCLKNEYSGLALPTQLPLQVVHHTAYLADLLAAGRLRPDRSLDEAVTYHDPCYLSRYNGEVDAARAILDRIAPGRVEMTRAGHRSRCCGGGGGAPLTDVPGERRIADMRVGDAREVGASLVAVACPNCMTMLEGVAAPRPEIADVAELLARCTGAGTRT